MLALSLSDKFCCFGVFVFVLIFFVFVFNRFLFFRFSFVFVFIIFFVFVSVFVNEFVIFSFFTIFVFVFVNENHTVMETSHTREFTYSLYTSSTGHFASKILRLWNILPTRQFACYFVF